MRTILLLGVAAGSLLLSGHATSAEAPLPGPHTDRSPSAAFGDDPRPRLDYGAPAATDTRVYTDYPDRVPSEVDYRGGTYPPPPPDAVYSGTYDAEGRWTGSWDGTYETPDGRRYEGRYEGTVEGRPGVAYAPPPYDPYYDRDYRGGYDPRDDADMVRRCGHGNAVGGAVVGGLLGGVAGNRIAGRGDRTAGTLRAAASGRSPAPRSAARPIAGNASNGGRAAADIMAAPIRGALIPAVPIRATAMVTAMAGIRRAWW